MTKRYVRLPPTFIASAATTVCRDHAATGSGTQQSPTELKLPCHVFAEYPDTVSHLRLHGLLAAVVRSRNLRMNHVQLDAGILTDLRMLPYQPTNHRSIPAEPPRLQLVENIVWA